MVSHLHFGVYVSLQVSSGVLTCTILLGTSISVFGTLTQGVKTPIVSSYSLDGGSKLLYSAPLNQTDVTYHNTFYNSPSVPLGLHSLAVQLEDVGAGGIFWLDYMTYTIPRADDTLPSTSAVIPETSHTLANSSAANSVTGNDIPIGVLVPAIIVPICVTLIFMLVGVWWIVKRRRAEWYRVVSELASPRSEHRACKFVDNVLVCVTSDSRFSTGIWKYNVALFYPGWVAGCAKTVVSQW